MRKDVLVERESTHGDFSHTAKIAQSMKSTMRLFPNWEQCDPRQREALDMIAVKMARILSGDSNFPDHWKDIEGYASLGREACK